MFFLNKLYSYEIVKNDGKFKQFIDQNYFPSKETTSLFSKAYKGI